MKLQQLKAGSVQLFVKLHLQCVLDEIIERAVTTCIIVGPSPPAGARVGPGAGARLECVRSRTLMDGAGRVLRQSRGASIVEESFCLIHFKTTSHCDFVYYKIDLTF